MWLLIQPSGSVANRKKSTLLIPTEDLSISDRSTLGDHDKFYFRVDFCLIPRIRNLCLSRHLNVYRQIFYHVLTHIRSQVSFHKLGSGHICGRYSFSISKINLKIICTSFKFVPSYLGVKIGFLIICTLYILGQHFLMNLKMLIS